MFTLKICEPIAAQAGIQGLAMAKGFGPPLAPIAQKSAKSTSYKVVKITECLTRVAVAEVVAPSTEHLIDFTNDIPQWLLIATARKRPNAVPYPCYGLLGWKYVEVLPVPAPQIMTVAQAKSKKAQSSLTFTHSYNARLFPIQRQSKMSLKLTFQPRSNPWPHPPCQHHVIIRISDQTCIGYTFGSMDVLMEGSIKVVKVDISQQRRNHPSLGSARFGPGDLLAPFFVYLHALTPEPQTNQAQHRSIRNASFDHSHELIMGNGVKVARKVRVVNLLSPGLEAFPDLVHGPVSIALRSETMGAVHEICLKDGFNHQQHGHLHYPVPYTGDTQGAQFAVRLGDVYAPHGQWAINAASKLLLNLAEESAYSLAILNVLDSYPIHSRRTSVGSHPAPGRFQHIRTADPVIESVKSVRRFLLGLATQLPSQKGDFHRHVGFRFEPFCYPFRYGAFSTQAASPFLDRNATEVRPLGSTGITPLPCYYGPLRLPATADMRVIDSSHSLSSSLTVPGLPGSSTDLSARALLNHPERLGWSFCSFLPNRWQASSSPGDWPPPFTCNEAESGSLSLGLAPSLSRQDLYHSPKGSHPLTGLLPAFGYPAREAAATC